MLANFRQLDRKRYTDISLHIVSGAEVARTMAAMEGAVGEQDPLQWIPTMLWAHKEALVSSVVFCVSAVLYWISFQMMTCREQKGIWDFDDLIYGTIINFSEF